MIVPARVYVRREPNASDACIDSSSQKACLRFGSDAHGKTVCEDIIDLDDNTPYYQITQALPLCDSTVPGCSTESFVCGGTTVQCDPYSTYKNTGIYECDCRPTIGYVSCASISIPPVPAVDPGRALNRKMADDFLGLVYYANITDITGLN